MPWLQVRAFGIQQKLRGTAHQFPLQIDASGRRVLPVRSDQVRDVQSGEVTLEYGSRRLQVLLASTPFIVALDHTKTNGNALCPAKTGGGLFPGGPASLLTISRFGFAQRACSRISEKRIPKSKPQSRDPHSPNQDSNQVVCINLFSHPGNREDESQPDKKKKIY